MNYAKIAFTDAVRGFQERYGSRASYGRMEEHRYTDGLTENEVEFIAHQDNFYMATNSESGFPYKVSLFLLDQAAKARLKIFAEASVISIEDNSELFDKLDLDDYKFRPERIILLKVKAYDWNCPQHITPRYTLEEIQDEFMAQHEYINKLRKENTDLKAQLAQ